MSHDFIEVENRRWCVNCDLFQTKEKGAAFFPTPRKPCPRNTNHAIAIDTAMNEPDRDTDMNR